jgi:Fe-Mn family superoxide dismutase
MPIEPKSFPLEGKVDGFLSEKQLTEHRDVLYKGYVTQYNNIIAALEKADATKANPHYSEWGELKRRETWAHNGVLLHEMYFENLGAKGGSPGKKTLEVINRDFGSLDNFRSQVINGSKVPPFGWTVWAYSMLDKKTHVYVVEQHQNHTPWGAIPLLVVDEFEHAYFIDYQTKRPAYLDKVWEHIDWNVVEKRVNDWLPK